MTTESAIQIDSDSGVTVVTFGPKLKHLDDHAVMEHQAQLLATADDATPPCVLFDLTNVSLFGSTFIETIFRVWHRLNARPDSRFALCGLSDYCFEVLQITHLDNLWTICPTRDEAIQKLSDG
ncbi:MAG: STAS domain-containing protein [Planctomycetaceae bacterium]